MATSFPFRLALAASFFLSWTQPVDGFFEEMFGGGGGGFQFQQMGGGGRPAPKPKWPKGITDKISKKYNWMKGTEWNWNNWRNVKFNKDGTFEAPTPDCERGQCMWSASGKTNMVYVLWGEAGLHELTVKGAMPAEQDPQKMKGLRLQGQRKSDGEQCFASFQRVHDSEAADLDKDLYEILGIDIDADDALIKKVYRTLSKKYHPDKNPDEESRKRFNDIRDAYEILSNPDKKIMYDTGGMEAVKKLEKNEVEKGNDVAVNLAVTLEDLYNSGTAKARMSNRRVVCTGCRQKSDSPKCKGCSRCPNERKVVPQQVGHGMFIQREMEIPSKEKCKQENTELSVNIEKGMKDGETVTYPRMAEQRPGMLPGNVVFTLKTKKNSKFTRRGNDLFVDMQVSLREALLGWEQQIRHLDGHIVKVATDSVTRPFQVLKIAGEGMPLKDDPATFGDMYVKVEVDFPSSLTPSQLQEVQKAFRPAPPREDL